MSGSPSGRDGARPLSGAGKEGPAQRRSSNGPEAERRSGRSTRAAARPGSAPLLSNVFLLALASRTSDSMAEAWHLDVSIFCFPDT